MPRVQLEMQHVCTAGAIWKITYIIGGRHSLYGMRVHIILLWCHPVLAVSCMSRDYSVCGGWQLPLATPFTVWLVWLLYCVDRASPCLHSVSGLSSCCRLRPVTPCTYTVLPTYHTSILDYFTLLPLTVCPPYSASRMALCYPVLWVLFGYSQLFSQVILSVCLS